MTSVTNQNPKTGEPGGTIARNMDNATSTAHRAIDKASGAIHPGVDQFASGAHQALDTLSGAANKAAETLGECGGQLRDAQSRLTTNCCASIRDRPLCSIGIAIAGGLLLGWLLRRR